MTTRGDARQERGRAIALVGWLTLAVSLPVLGATRAAHAESSVFLQRDNPLRGWLPSPEARAERERAALEQRLEALLARQPGVEGADVVVSLPVVAHIPLEQPTPTARATLVVRALDGRVDLPRLAELARGQLPFGAEVQVTRLDAQPPRARSLAPLPPPGAARRVGPFQVEEASAGTLRATLAALLVSNALLAGLLLGRRRRG